MTEEGALVAELEVGFDELAEEDAVFARKNIGEFHYSGIIS